MTLNRKVKLNLSAWSTVVLILIIVVLINLISIRVFRRLDLTEHKMFTLSSASREVAGNLDDRLTIKAYFSEDLPAPYNSMARYLKDQLDEYKAYSHGNMHYEFIDPGSEESLEEEAQSFRIPPVQVNAIENDKIEIKKVYMGLVFLYEDKTEVMPVVQSTMGLEYDITSMIKRITATQLKTVGFVTGHDEPELFKDLGSVSAVLQKNYQVRPVDLSNDLVPEDIETLMILRPQKAFSEWEQFSVDQFLMRGGKLALLINKVKTELETSQASRTYLDMDEWLRTYGVKINDDLVVDLQCNRINVQQRQGFFAMTHTVNYPFFPQVTRFDRDNVMVKGLENIALYFPSSIDTSLAGARGLEARALFWSSDRSGVQKGRFDIHPLRRLAGSVFNKKGIVLGATIRGTFSSYFADKEVPMKADSTREEGIEIIKESPSDVRIVVVGDGTFMGDQYGTKSNMAFFLNMVDWLSMDEGLISIRSREVTDRPLKELSGAAKRLVKYLNIFGSPLLVVLFGLAYWQIRRAKQRAMELAR